MAATLAAGKGLSMTLSMNIPLWVMLGFSGWTLAVLMGSIGIYRWYRMLTTLLTLVVIPVLYYVAYGKHLGPTPQGEPT